MMINAVAGSPWLSTSFRRRIYRHYGYISTDDVGLNPWVRMREATLRMGSRSALGVGVVIDGFGHLEVGARTGIGANCTVLTTTHYFGPARKRSGEFVHTRVVVGEGSWIGAGTTIMPGVRIGDGVIVGSGSLVTTDLESHGLYVGRPARLVRRLDDDETDHAPNIDPDRLVEPSRPVVLPPV